MSQDPFEMLDVSYEEALAVNEDLMRKGPRDQRICLCGHAVSRHTEIVGIVQCKPSKMDCACKKVRAVLEVSDTRFFLRTTEGSGAMHALTRGMVAARAKGVRIEWLGEVKCDKCGAVGPVSPVTVTPNLHAANYDTGFNSMLCAECRAEL
jgi:hypothetical protein